jgi:hypothetical protein
VQARVGVWCACVRGNGLKRGVEQCGHIYCWPCIKRLLHVAAKHYAPVQILKRNLYSDIYIVNVLLP